MIDPQKRIRNISIGRVGKKFALKKKRKYTFWFESFGKEKKHIYWFDQKKSIALTFFFISPLLLL